MPRRSHRRLVDAVVRRIRESARTDVYPAEGELRAAAQSIAARRKSGDSSDDLLLEALVTCAHALWLVTGRLPAEEVVAAAAHAAVGVVPLLPDGALDVRQWRWPRFGMV